MISLDDDEPAAPPAKPTKKVNGHAAESFETARPVGRVALPERHQAPAAGSTGRTLPVSIDAEEHLLCCVFIDSEETLTRCEDARITPFSFSEAGHQIIFNRMVAMRKAGIEIATGTLTEELMANRELESAGGVPRITHISGKSPTTAQAGYYAGKVRELALLRELIRSATSITESCYGFSGGIEDFISEQQARLKSVADQSSPPTRSPLVPLTDFAIPQEGDSSILLGNRYLNRGDGAVLVGTSGMGKSSMSIQCACLWSLGRAAFGIPSNGPLRSLVVQSEDSDGDVAEMMLSVCHGLNLTALEKCTVGSSVKVWSERVLRGDRFISALRKKIAEFKPDLVWLNPLQAYLVGDITKGEDVSRFLREGLNGLNQSTFGYIIVHHTTKPATGKDRGERQWHEVMYDMAGGAEIINWARAILSLRAASTEGEFNLVLAKRGRRAGVTKEVTQGIGVRAEPVTTIPLKHAKGFIPAASIGQRKDLPLIFWEPREPDQAPEKDDKAPSSGRAPKYDFADYRALFPSKTSAGLPVAQLGRLLDANGKIPPKTLPSVCKRWADEGMVEILRPVGLPTLYRAAI